MQDVPCGCRQIPGQFDKIRHGIHSEHKLHSLVMPAVQMPVLREVRVTTQSDRTEAGPTAQINRPIEVRERPFLRRTIAGSVQQVQSFAGVRERQQQRMAASLLLVVHPDTLLALTGCFDHRAVRFDDGHVKKKSRVAAFWPSGGTHERIPAVRTHPNCRTGDKNLPRWWGPECVRHQVRAERRRPSAAVPDVRCRCCQPAGCSQLLST